MINFQTSHYTKYLYHLYRAYYGDVVKGPAIITSFATLGRNQIRLLTRITNSKPFPVIKPLATFNILLAAEYRILQTAFDREFELTKRSLNNKLEYILYICLIVATSFMDLKN